MPSVKTSGSQTASIGTEHTLATVTDAGTYELVVDINALVNGDIVELRVYGKARSSDTERLEFIRVYGPIAPGSNGESLVRSIPVVSPHHLKLTLKQTTGTGRAFPWAVYQA